AADPAAAGLAGPDTGSQAAVEPTGHTTTVQVEARDMRFFPEHISVPEGDRLVIELTNTDDGNIHDLTLGGATTDRLAPGESEQLDVGVVSQDLEGWCTVAGHRQMGMVFTVDAVADDGQDEAGAAEGGAEAGSDAEAGSGADAGDSSSSDEASPDQGNADGTGSSAVVQDVVD